MDPATANIKIQDNIDPTSTYDPYRDYVQNIYPCFQDIHVMVYIGFGFLMTFVKTMSFTALSFNWIISIWAF
jgi:ammonium transporter Rh